MVSRPDLSGRGLMTSGLARRVGTAGMAPLRTTTILPDEANEISPSLQHCEECKPSTADIELRFQRGEVGMNRFVTRMGQSDSK